MITELFSGVLSDRGVVATQVVAVVSQRAPVVPQLAHIVPAIPSIVPQRLRVVFRGGFVVLSHIPP